MSPGFSDIHSVRPLFGAVFVGSIFGVLMYMFQRLNLKKAQ